MKRIIDGVTFNTETATEVGSGVYRDEDTGVTTTTTLYQNRVGVYFAVEEVESTYKDRHGDLAFRSAFEWYAIKNAEDARKFAEQYQITLIRDIEDMPPEAEAGERTATVYVRMPPSLKAALDARAEKEQVSLNTLALRCLEACLQRKAATDQAA